MRKGGLAGAYSEMNMKSNSVGRDADSVRAVRRTSHFEFSFTAEILFLFLLIHHVPDFQ